MERPLRRSWLPWVVLFAMLAIAKLVSAEPYKAEPGPYAVKTFLLDLQDQDRDRTVPVKVYLPKQARGARPVVLVSHGLGGTREGLAYLGNHWASHGYICVHMQHAGSDASVWKEVKPSERLKAMRAAARDPVNALDRAADTTFVVDELARLNKDEDSQLLGKLNLSKTGIAGHSFGAWTAMVAGGLLLGGEQELDVSELRVRCMIPLSPPVSQIKKWRQRNYGALSIPALFMTGTLDTSLINSTTAKERQIPYKLMPGTSENGQPKYQINFNGADHMTFSGETRRSLRSKVSREDNKIFHSLILQSTTAFLDCYLLGDQEAKKWLNDGAFVRAVGKHGDVSMDAK